jgi:hypothetical protein
MCFSEQASIVSFTAGILGSALCFSLGTIPDKVIGLFLGYVSLMQGIEFLLWRHQICDDYNRTLSITGMLLNHMQPIMLGLIILYIARPKTSVSIIVLMSIYAMIITIYSIPFFENTSNQCTLKNETNHLQWKWNTMKGNILVYIFFAFTICAIFILGVKYGVKFAFITLFTYLSSLFLYPQAVAGAMWCYYVAFLPFIYFMGRLLL